MNTQLRPLYRGIASRIVARMNCQNSGNHEWQAKHIEWLADAEKNLLPSGSGIDCGTKIDVDASSARKIVLFAEYHHMNDNGMYDGWTSHKITITPSFDGIDIHISGRNRNEIKDYLHDVYHHCLTSIVDISQERPEFVTNS